VSRRVKVLISVAVAFSLTCINLPQSFAAAPSVPQRVLVDAPDPVAATAPAPATPKVVTGPQGVDIIQGSATSERATSSGKTAIPGTFTHVKKLAAADVAALEQSNSTVITSAEGRLTATFTGKDGAAYKVVLEDGVLKSGRQVVSISFVKNGAAIAPAPASAAGLFRLPITNASANTTWFLRCSYATKNGYYGDLYVHLCAIDVFLVAGVLALLAALIGGLVGALVGNVVGAIVGLGVGTVLGLLVILFLWWNMASDGSVSFTIPYWTMVPPFGGYIYVNSSGRWLYMWNQCWIQYDGIYYHPYC
jgi:hypothetical protein